MKVFEKKLNELVPYEQNPRRNDSAVDAVAASIKEFGWKQPIVVDKDNVIIAGHTRYKAAMKLGLETAPCVVADDLTAEQIKAFRIADNKTGELATWDNDLPKDELLSVLDDFDMTEFGFGDFELTMLTEDFEPEPYDKELVKEYSQNEQEYLIKKRVIITYRDQDEEEVKSLLGLEEISKVVYDIVELM